MVFNPERTIKTSGNFSFGGSLSAEAHPCLCKTVISEFWRGFTYNSSELALSPIDLFELRIGEAAVPELGDDAYAINIERGGVRVVARDEHSLILGFMTLIDRIRAVDIDDRIGCEIDCCSIVDSPKIANRMVHFCVLPETDLWELRRFVRLCGALKYSHIIIEFWGMLQYDCMRELGWHHAFRKDEIRPIIAEAHELGLEVIPMFNHWGHASASRVMHGKHVVLNQNPALQTYFSEDGWCWDIKKPKVRELLASIRTELIELCGEGEYFHIGCDEAYNFDLENRESMDAICDFINGIADSLEVQGRRAIVWGDMFLYKYPNYEPKNCYACNCPSPESAKYMIDRLSRKLVIADWQYDSPVAPVETSAVFAEAGFDCLLCPWDRGFSHMSACISTIKEGHLFGIIHTTWHTLSKGMPYVMTAAVGCFEEFTPCSRRLHRTQTAALLRKIFFVDGDYEKSGWSRVQINSIT